MAHHSDADQAVSTLIVTSPFEPSRGQNPTLASHFLRVFTIDALVRVSNVALLPVYLMLMSQEEYATYSYLFSLVGALVLVLNFGLYVAQSKLVHDLSEHEIGRFLYTLNFLLVLLLTLVLLPSYWLGWDRTVVKALFSPSIRYEDYRYLVLAGIVLAAYAQLILNFLLSTQNIASVQKFNLARLIAGTCLTLAALYAATGDGAKIRLEALLIAEALVIGVALFPYVRRMQFRFDFGLARRSLTLGLPIMVSGALGIAINFGDKYFIGRFCSLGELSIYFFGFTVAGVLSAIWTTLHNVWMPLFLKEKDVRQNLMRTRRLAAVILALFTFLSVAIWAVVALALQFRLIDPAYAEVLSVLPIQLLAALCSALVGLLSSYTIYWNMTYMTIAVGVGVAALSLPLNLVSVRAAGIHGAAATSVVLNVAYGLAYLYIIKRRLAESQGRAT